MSLEQFDSQILPGYRVVGSFDMIPDQDPDTAEGSIVFNLGLGGQPRGLYVKNSDSSYTRLMSTNDNSAQIIHTYATDETTLTDTNAPLARRFFLNTHRYITLLDLSNYTECRLLVNKQTTAGATGYKLAVEYRAAGFSTSVANYIDIGTSEVSVVCDVQNQLLDSGWIALDDNAKADVAVCVTSEGGDGVLDPQFGSVIIQFR